MPALTLFHHANSMPLTLANAQLNRLGLPTIAPLGKADEPGKGASSKPSGTRASIAALNSQIFDAQARIAILRPRTASGHALSRTSLAGSPAFEVQRRQRLLNQTIEAARKTRTGEAWTAAFEILAIHALAIEHQSPVFWTANFLADLNLDWAKITPRAARALADPILKWSTIEARIQPSASIALLFPFADATASTRASAAWNQLLGLAQSN